MNSTDFLSSAHSASSSFSISWRVCTSSAENGSSISRMSGLFITHDLEEAIALSDRVVVLSAGPGTRPIGDFRIDLPRPRDVSEIRMTPAFLALHKEIWGAMKEEVLKAYQRQKAA